MATVTIEYVYEGSGKKGCVNRSTCTLRDEEATPEAVGLIVKTALRYRVPIYNIDGCMVTVAIGATECTYYVDAMEALEDEGHGRLAAECERAADALKRSFEEYDARAERANTKYVFKPD